MTGEEYLVNELSKYNCICYYPSSGTDLSNMDFFGSGKLLWEDRVNKGKSADIDSEAISNQKNMPDLYIHTDVNLYQEIASGLDELPDNSGIHGKFEVMSFKELPTLDKPNLIFDNYEYSGKCFEYKLRIWGSSNITTLIFCLCENEYLISKILIPNKINVSIIWSKNWNGGYTYGTWIINVLERLNTIKVYTDWLCIPGNKGEPNNNRVSEQYPNLMTKTKTKLVRNNDIHWIDEGAHGWLEEFDVEN